MPLLNVLLIPVTAGRLALLAPNVLCDAALGPWVLPPVLPPPSRALTWCPGSAGISFAPGKPKTRSPTNSFLKAKGAQEQKNDPRGHLPETCRSPVPAQSAEHPQGSRPAGCPFLLLLLVADLGSLGPPGARLQQRMPRPHQRLLCQGLRAGPHSPRRTGYAPTCRRRPAGWSTGARGPRAGR